MSATGIFPTDGWTIATGRTDAGPAFLRYRSGEPDPASKAQFTTLVIVKWAYEPRNETGLPTPDTVAQMDEFEDRILDASDADGRWGSGVAIATHNGFREWRFYTPDVNDFMAKFNDALAGWGPYPLDLQAFDDPEWEGFREMRIMAGRDA